MIKTFKSLILVFAALSSAHAQTNAVSASSPLTRESAPVIKTIRQEKAEKASISEAVKKILNASYKNHHPAKALLKPLVDSDKPALIKEFREQPFTNKIHSFWALAYLGGDDVREEFRKILEDDYSQQTLNAEDMRVIERIALGFGYLATEDPIAYHYLLEHLKPDDWIGVRKFEIASLKLDLNGFMASAMITAVGISSREDAPQVLDNITKWDEASLSLVDSSVVEAFFYLHQAPAANRKETVLYYVNLDSFEHFCKWAETETGKKWDNWARVRHKLPPL